MSDEESSLPEVGDVVGGRFRIVEHLGTGGFGTVYRAIQKNIGREVALKFLTPGVAEDPINVERFRREAYHVSQLRHPNTITLFDYGQTEGGLVYMVMELLDGVSLAGTLEDEGALPLARAAHIFIKVLKSLSEAHDHGLVHRDLKPENIYLCEMFGQKDYVKVLDFGVAKMTQMGGDESGGSDLTKQGHIFGTPMYMAPEQACDEAITPATDTYSLGLLLFEMITGMPPVTGESRMDVIHKQIKDPVPKLPQALEGTPLGRIIRQACVKDEEERFQNAGEFVDAFVDAIREMNIVPQPEGEAEPEMAFALAGSAVPEETEQADREHPADTDTTVTAVGAEETRPAEPAEIDDETQTISEGDILDDAVAEKPELPDDQDERRRHQRGRARYDLPLVGREDILEELTEIVGESVQASDGHIVLLEGESGIGKTRVIHALAERASSRGMVVPIGHFRQRAAPMEGVREALADYWGVSHRDRAEVREALEADLADAESFTDEEIDFLVDFIRPKTSRDTPVPESPEEARALYARLERIFLKLAERDPLLIVFEDIQHSDSATLAFLEYLAVTLRTEPAEIVVAMTLRPEERASNPDLEPSLKTMNANIGVGFTRVPLRRLQGNDLAELLDAILPLEPKLKERVGWLSQGVPLHAIQIIRYLENEGRLVENASGRMELAEGSPRDIDLPPDLMDLMELRIDQAAEAGRDEEQVRAVLEWLAVLGVRTPVELLERVAEKTERIDVDRLDETLEALSEEGILRQVLHRNLLCAEFDNSLIRETLLEGLSGRWANQRYNREAAVEKVEFYRQRGQEIPLVEVADHWRKAGELEKYRDALFEAAHRSMERFDPRGARDRFRELLPLLDELDDRSDKWVRTHLALAELGRRFGEFGVAEEHYRSVIEEGHATAEQRAQALRGLGELLVVQARYDEARDIFGRALTLSRDSEPVDFPGVAKALTGLSKVALLQGEPEEGARVRKQLKDVLPELPEGEISGKVLVHLSEVAKRLGRMSDQYEYLVRARAQLEKSDDHQALGNALIALGSSMMRPAMNAQDRFDRANDLLQEALDLMRSIGDRHGVAEAFRSLARLKIEVGEYERAKELGQKALDIHEALGAPFNLGMTHRRLAVAEILSGETDRALEDCDAAIEYLEQVGDKMGVANVLFAKGVAAMDKLDFERAREELSEARRIKESFGSSWDLFDVRNHLALVDMWFGNFGAAETNLEQTLEHVDEHGTAEDRAVARSLMGLLRCFQSRLHQAALEMGRARADAEDLGTPRVTDFCEANAAFYAKLTNNESTYNNLVDSVVEAEVLNDIQPLTWLESLERMARTAVEREQTRQSARLMKTTAHFWDAFGYADRADELIEAIRSLGLNVEPQQL